MPFNSDLSEIKNFAVDHLGERAGLVNQNGVEHHRCENHDALLELLEFLKTKSYRFTAVTPMTHARINARDTDRKTQGLRDIFGWNRVFPKVQAGLELFELMQAANILEQVNDDWRSRIRVASLDTELFIHSAFPTTQADAIFFGPDTYRYIAALKYHLSRHSAPIKRILDIGCGAGPGAIIAAKIFPEAKVVATDINNLALETTRLNADAAGVKNIEALNSDLFSNVIGDFDLIISNPPYLLDTSQRAYRHGGGNLGEGLSADIVAGGIQRLARNGSLMLYTGVAICNGNDPFFEKINSLLSNEFQWAYAEIDPDIFSEELLQKFYSGADRIAAIRLEVVRTH